MRRNTLLALVAVAVLAAAAYLGWREWPLTVEAVAPTRGPAIEAVYATGVVEPTVMVPVAPRTSGRLVAIEVEEGATVKRGQVLARLDAPDLEHAVAEAQAKERLAQLQYERTQRLVAQGFVSPAERDRTRAELDAARAALQRVRAQRDYNVLVAPADGTVLRRDGEPGQFVTSGQTLLTLACCAPLRVSAEVDEEDIARVKVGQVTSLRSDALPNKLFDGIVAEITPKGDPVSRSYRVRIRFADPTGLATSGLRSGMTMDVNVIVSRRENALLVPSRALQGNALWVVKDGHLDRRKVQRGASGGGRTEVTAGLDDDQPVVLSPADTLREGRRARVVEPASGPAPVTAR
jgi:RND family efflux transporter MFP subunit